jgi:hypothetical protein
MKWVLYVAVLCSFIGLASASFFPYFDFAYPNNEPVVFFPLPFTIEEIERPIATPTPIPPSVSSPPNLTLPPREIVITEEGFEPEEVHIRLGQEIIWRNHRDTLPAYIIGMREITPMRSVIFPPTEKFHWSFSEPGKYVYVDGIVIGLQGKIYVQ